MATINLTLKSVFEEIEVASAIHGDKKEKFATAHCVSEDFQMGRGIAVSFK